MTSTNPTEPSGEGKSGPIVWRGPDGPLQLWTGYTGQGGAYKTSTPADLLAAGYVEKTEYDKAERLWKQAAIDLDAAQRDAKRGWDEVHALMAEHGATCVKLTEAQAELERVRAAADRWRFLATQLSGAIEDHGDCDGCSDLLRAINAEAEGESLPETSPPAAVEANDAPSKA
jgi:hypothetical protein